MYQNGDQIGIWTIKKLTANGISETYLAESGEDNKRTTGILKRYVKQGSNEKQNQLATEGIALRQKEILERLTGIKGIPQILEFISRKDDDILVLEYMPGKDLEKRIINGGVLDEHNVISIGIKVAEIFKEIHKRGVVHNDIKPSNIVIDSQNGSVSIIDFESATLIGQTRAGIAMGTKYFSAPEYLNSKTGCIASDIYSFGSLLYYLLTGIYRNQEDGTTIVLQHARQDIHYETLQIIEKCCYYDPKGRYTDFSEIVQKLMSLNHNINGKRLIGDVIQGYQEHESFGHSQVAMEKGITETIGRTLLIGIACGCLFLIIFLIGRYLGYGWIVNAVTNQAASLRGNQSLWISLMMTLLIFTIRIVVRHSDPVVSKLLVSAIELPMDVLGVLLGYAGALLGLNLINAYDALTYLIMLIIFMLITCCLCYYNEGLIRAEKINKVMVGLLLCASYFISIGSLMVATSI